MDVSVIFTADDMTSNEHKRLMRHFMISDKVGKFIFHSHMVEHQSQLIDKFLFFFNNLQRLVNIF